MQSILSNNEFTNVIETEIESFIQKIAEHPLFRAIKNLQQLRVFSEHHVFAVWDFMCLLKKLQSHITCMTVPWVPPSNALGSHLINEIVSEEESDVTADGNYLSHFELYREAMHECGANTRPIDRLLKKLQKGDSVQKALQAKDILLPAKRFVYSTFKILDKEIHEITAAFVYGREGITYKMFNAIIENLSDGTSNKINKFFYYFNRHIELDKNEHAPKSKRLLASLCGKSKKKWYESIDAAKFALQARREFLDEIYIAILKI